MLAFHWKYNFVLYMLADDLSMKFVLVIFFRMPKILIFSVPAYLADFRVKTVILILIELESMCFN